MLAILFGPVVIPWLKKMKFGQTIYELGLDSHKVKQGTPNMGGIIFAVPMILVPLIMCSWNPVGSFLPIVLASTLGFGMIGFVDDYIKVSKKRSEGLTPMQKTVPMFVISAGLALWGIHLAAALLVALLFCRRQIARTTSPPPVISPAAAFITAVGSAAETMVRLSAFVVFFTVVMALLTSLFGTVPPLLAGFLELTVGVTALSPHRLGFTLAAGLLGWGGVSVHCQAAAVLSDTDLSLRHYLLGKALQGLFSAAAAWWVYGLI